MPVTVLVAPAERPAFAFALSRSSAFYARGTTEQRESALALGDMLRGFEGTPPGAVEMEFLIQDAYLLGIRLFYTQIELEEYWLDACARASGTTAAGPLEPELDQTVRRYLSELAAEPLGYPFDSIRSVFTDLGFKLDRGVAEAAPRARGMYNADREVMSDKAIAIREQHARVRAASSAETEEVLAAAVAVAERPAASFDWGVDVQTGLSPDDIPIDSFRPLTIGSVRLFITNYAGQLGAVSGSCTHQRAGLAKGRVRGTVIECPRHGSEFDLRDGKQVCPPFCQRWMDRSGMLGRLLALATPDKRGGDLPRFPIRVENDEIVLRI